MGDKGRAAKETVMNLDKYVDKSIRVKLMGGREVQGILKGHDTLLNLVLDKSSEIIPDEETGEEKSRDLGLCVCRGTAVLLISPSDGVEIIANPFAQ